MSSAAEEAEREEIESAAFGQAKEGPPAKTGINSDVTLRTVIARVAGKKHRMIVDAPRLLTGCHYQNRQRRHEDEADLYT